MKILMVTNTYSNIVGGLEKSIHSFASKFRELGHDVLIAGPDSVGLGLDDTEKKSSLKTTAGEKEDVHATTRPLRPLALPFRAKLERQIAKFNPDIVHAHHPFLMGEMALRFSIYYDRPVVFTYHILFYEYAHYLPVVSSEFSAPFLVALTSGFSNLTTRVIAPSESVLSILSEQGVKRPIDVVPTGIQIDKFANGNRKKREKS